MRIAWALTVVLATGCVQLFSLEEGKNVDTDNDAQVDGASGGPDNCDGVYNPDQSDFDRDGIGDACDTCDSGGDVDADADGIPDGCDGCVGDGVDADADGIPDNCDPCVIVGSGLAEVDVDDDGIPDLCDGCIGNGVDRDTDGIPDNCDSCISPNNADSDVDGIPDACDPCPQGGGLDGDGDGIEDACDVCRSGGGRDLDQDGLEDAGPGGGIGDNGCDPCYGPNLDEDTDGVHDACDNCPGDANPDQSNVDGILGGDGVGDACEVDSHGGTRHYFDAFTTQLPDWLVSGGEWTTGPSELRMIAGGLAVRERYPVSGSFRISSSVTSFGDDMGKVRLFATDQNRPEELVCQVFKYEIVISHNGNNLTDTLMPNPVTYPQKFVMTFDASRNVVTCEFGGAQAEASIMPAGSTWTTGLGGEATTATFGFFAVTSES